MIYPVYPINRIIKTTLTYKIKNTTLINQITNYNFSIEFYHCI